MAPRQTRAVCKCCSSSSTTESTKKPDSHSQVTNVTIRDNFSYGGNLPASSCHCKPLISKTKILNEMKQTMEADESLDKTQDTEDIIQKKIDLVLRIKSKLDDFGYMQALLKVEKRENECLGKEVLGFVEQNCNNREQEKYNILVHDVDKIVSLLHCIAGRLKRVENAIQMLHADSDPHEIKVLRAKREKLREQNLEAQQLKKNSDNRQRAVSKVLAGRLDKEQFADFEHYLKIKVALIMEQRELDEKVRLGEERIESLQDALPEKQQIYLNDLLK